MRVCQVDGCEKPFIARDLCKAHYRARRESGELPLLPRKQPKLCAIDGCARLHVARTWCRHHYARWRKHGDPLGGQEQRVGCQVADCDGGHFSRGCCESHYRRMKRYGDPLGSQTLHNTVRDDRGHKLCATCKEWLAEERFGAYKKRPDGLNSTCRTCVSAANRQWRFGLSAQDVAALLESQHGVCAICRTDNPGVRGWNVDHDHACCPTYTKSARTCGECVRGLLCVGCNTALGGFRDRADLLLAAVGYLERSRKATRSAA